MDDETNEINKSRSRLLHCGTMEGAEVGQGKLLKPQKGVDSSPGFNYSSHQYPEKCQLAILSFCLEIEEKSSVFNNYD